MNIKNELEELKLCAVIEKNFHAVAYIENMLCFVKDHPNCSALTFLILLHDQFVLHHNPDDINDLECMYHVKPLLEKLQLSYFETQLN